MFYQGVIICYIVSGSKHPQLGIPHEDIGVQVHSGLRSASRG